jgi:hypothetical protein
MANMLLDFEELPQCGNSLRVLRCKTPCLDCIHPEGVPLRKGLEGRGHRRWPCGHGTQCRDGTPGKPGFLRSKKCAQMKL